jgi:hypothetical protein
MNVSEYESNRSQMQRYTTERSRLLDKSDSGGLWSWVFVPAWLGAAFAIGSTDIGGWEGLAFLMAFPGFVLPLWLAISINNRGTPAKLEELNQLISAAQDKVRSHEDSVWNPYETQLQGLYYGKLYQQRSGSFQFAAALAEYEAKIEEAEIAIADFTWPTHRYALSRHRDYLTKRIDDHAASGNAAPVRRAPEVKAEKKEIVPPERSYRTPRKVDWNALNQKRQLTGLKGEEVALIIEQEYLTSVNRKDLADKVRNLAQAQGDGLGYDLLSFFADGREKYIEVKSTTGSLDAPFYLSRDELSFLREHPGRAFLYRISLRDGNASLKSFTAAEVEMQEITPVTFVVKSKSN